MERLPPISWDRLVTLMRRRLDETVEQMADVIKDAMLDWSPVDGGDPLGEDLPRLSADHFVEAMRGRVEDVLRQMAEAVNDSPAGQLSAAREEQMGDLFAQLWCTATELGRQMRRDAA